MKDVDSVRCRELAAQRGSTQKGSAPFNPTPSKAWAPDVSALRRFKHQLQHQIQQPLADLMTIALEQSWGPSLPKIIVKALTVGAFELRLGQTC
jgi:hypothetical protein